MKRSGDSAQVALKVRRQELAAEEADIADSRVRYEAERMLDFYDELNDRKVRVIASFEGNGVIVSRSRKK